MIGEAEYPPAGRQHRACQPLVFCMRYPFGREHDPVQQPQSRTYPCQFERPPERRTDPVPAGPAQIRKHTGKARGQRYFQDPVLAEPIGRRVAMTEIGPFVVPEIGARHDAGIDSVTEFGQDVRRIGANPVPAGFVYFRAVAEPFGNFLGQAFELRFFKVARQVAGIGIQVRYLLVERRGHPRMQVRADLTQSVVVKFLQRGVAALLARHRIVDDVGRPDTVFLENPMRPVLR